MLRVTVAHDVESGLALRLAWGPANGEKATSEQKLMEEVMARLPAGAVVMGGPEFRRVFVGLARPAAGACRRPAPEPCDRANCSASWKAQLIAKCCGDRAPTNGGFIRSFPGGGGAGPRSRVRAQGGA
jgi:hypothetical protein